MKRVLRALVTATTALAVVATPAVAVAAPPGPDREGLQKRLDDVAAAGGIGVLAEVRDEDGVWRGTSGVAQLGTSRPVPAQGRFRAGSVTKTFISTVILQLVEDGKLRLDDTVEKWLPGMVPGGDRITLRHLLNHTSGLYDFLRTLIFPPNPDFLDSRWRTWTATEMVQRAVAHPPMFETPGEAFSYSNTNYALLGLIIEKATGESYADEIERRLIRPLKLSGTSMPGTSPWIRGPQLRGYVPIEGRDGVQLVDYTEVNPSVFGAGGELISTARDLDKFFAALLDGDLLPAHLLAEMKTQGIPGGKRYGLGLAWRDTICGITVYGNDGDSISYNTWSFSTADGKRQATIALTPTHRGDPDDAVDAFLNKAFCG